MKTLEFNHHIYKNVGMLQPKSKGRMVVCGSAHMFSDEYIDKEENAKIFVSFILHGFY